jgi:aminopeptidase N
MFGLRFFTILLLLSFRISAQTDLRYVDLKIIPNFINHSIQATIDQVWFISPVDSLIQLELYPELETDEVFVNSKKAVWKRTFKGIDISISEADPIVNIRIEYHGKPREAKNPPWDGGFIWKKDTGNIDWLSVACQDEGAQLWWPAPVRYNDEPDSAKITCTYPDRLFFKSNGKLFQDTKHKDHTRTTSWKVSSPINTYNITLNIGNYASLKDTMRQVDGSQLQLHYYPLKINKAKALQQFQQVKPMLRCFEKHFGPYPFHADGYSLVETPYAGMEHQSAIAYGNGYVNGYNGEDYSGIGVGFDFILIHETGHEWWGNSVSAATASDFWLQEAFCTYAEYVYVHDLFGMPTAEKYIEAKKRLVSNNAPILGENASGIDMYAKGALMIHTLQQFASNESEWWIILKDFAQEHRWMSITTIELEKWFSERMPGVSPAFFEQYLRLAEPPMLEYNAVEINEKTQITFRISNAVKGFRMPVYWKNTNGERTLLFAEEMEKTVEIMGNGVYPETQTSYFQIKTR